MEPDEIFAVAKDNTKAAFQGCYVGLGEDPENPQYLEALAYCFMQIERWPVAFHILNYLTMVHGDVPEILNNKAMCASAIASGTGDDRWLDEAEKLLRKALVSISLIKKPASVYNNLALCLVNKGDFKGGEVMARKAIDIDDEKGARESLGYALLGQGIWEEGFANYESALYGEFRTPSPIGDEPYYHGEIGCKVLVCGEQGLGDEINFASVLPDVAAENEVTLECAPRLKGLFSRSFPTIKVYGTRMKDRDWTATVDRHCLIGSLFPWYRQKKEDFPGTPYLVADPERRLQWRTLLDTLPGKKVGIAWTGGLPSTYGKRRSKTLKDFAPFLVTEGITWISLQYKDPTAEINELGLDVRHWKHATETQDYDDTAALVAELDLVITVPTAVMELAGALGVPCWTLVPKKSHWRLAQESTPWYNSVRIFRDFHTMKEAFETDFCRR